MMDWLRDSLLYWLDIFAGYEIEFLPKQITIISVWNCIYCNLDTPNTNGRWGRHLFFVENPILVIT